MHYEKQESSIGILPDDQARVDAHFRARVTYWDELYNEKTVFAKIHQDRLATVQAYVDKVALPRGAHVLEVGCGAGHVAVALAERGYLVEASDSVEDMIQRTRQRANQAGVAERVSTTVADISRLPYPNHRFPLVVCIGVIPWIPRPAEALRELGRLVAVGGHIILTADNSWRLQHVLDPMKSPLLGPIRRVTAGAKRLLTRDHRRPQGDWLPTNRCTMPELDRLLKDAELERVHCRMLGFGPLTFFDRKVFSDSLGARLHSSLQRLSDSGFPILPSTAAQYIVLARSLPHN